MKLSGIQTLIKTEQRLYFKNCKKGNQVWSLFCQYNSFWSQDNLWNLKTSWLKKIDANWLCTIWRNFNINDFAL
jgi:hypothetical protein